MMVMYSCFAPSYPSLSSPPPLFFSRFIYLRGKIEREGEWVNEWERKRSSFLWFIPRMSTVAGARPGVSWEPDSLESLMWLSEVLVLGLSSFPGILAGTWIQSGAARVWAGTHKIHCITVWGFDFLLTYMCFNIASPIWGNCQCMDLGEGCLPLSSLCHLL